jgi:hypothetical protein
MNKAGYDVVIVGAGPAGMTAAYYAARSGRRVLLLDRKTPPGEKILLSGGGRCNVLPRSVDPSSYTTDSSPHTLKKILLSFPLPEVRAFLEGPVGLRLVEDKKAGKVYPATGGGKEVRDRLLAAAKRAGAFVRTGTSVVDLAPKERRRVVLDRGESIVAERAVLATGGLSYPKTGSDGAGLEIARRLGHHVIEPYPALVSLRGGSPAHHRLAGLSLPVTLRLGTGKGAASSSGDFLFTHRGYSGPVVLNLAHHAARAALAGEHPPITVSWGEKTKEDWEEILSGLGKRTVRGLLKEALPDRLVDLLLEELGLLSARMATLRRDERRRLLSSLADYPLPWRRCGGFSEAEVTGGGVPLAEVDSRTLESRMAPRSYLCGEILDAFGPIGGTNFLWAFVTGRLAGEGASR